MHYCVSIIVHARLMWSYCILSFPPSPRPVIYIGIFTLSGISFLNRLLVDSSSPAYIWPIVNPLTVCRDVILIIFLTTERGPSGNMIMKTKKVICDTSSVLCPFKAVFGNSVLPKSIH